jgi:hypothetical protein
VGLRAVFDAIAEILGPTVTFVGPERALDNSKPPRISWDPKAGKQIDPSRTGGGPGDDGHIMAREWSVEIEVWGEDFDATEELANAFLAAVHDTVTRFSYRPGEEQWDTGGVTAKGARCLMALSIVAPIPRTAEATIRPTIAVAFRMNNTELG